MKTRIRGFVIAVTLLGGLSWSATYTSFTIGQPVSDAEAMTICGGCNGAAEVDCPSGTACASNKYFTLGNIDYMDGTGDKSCGGTINCAKAYSGRVACSR